MATPLVARTRIVGRVAFVRLFPEMACLVYLSPIGIRIAIYSTDSSVSAVVVSFRYRYLFATVNHNQLRYRHVHRSTSRVISLVSPPIEIPE